MSNTYIEHSFKFIYTVEPRGDDKSIAIDFCHARQALWILNHFSHLEIKKLELSYRVHNGYRQRKDTKYPERKLRKKFTNTRELIAYLFHQPYQISHFQIDFSNGWRIKDQPYMGMIFQTNNSQERQELFNRFCDIAAIPHIELNELKKNITHVVQHDGKLIEIGQFF